MARVHPKRRFKWPARRDWLFAELVGVLSVPLAFVGQGDNAHIPDMLGWTLFGLSALTIAWRRHYPLGALMALIVVEGNYHRLDNAHSALILVTIVMVYSLAVAGPRRRTLIVIPTLLVTTVCMMSIINPKRGQELLQTSGWVLACGLTGEAVRVHRNYIGAIVERAERAERTHEEMVARGIAEERLRIARDLHDLLAHSITVIGVQTSVASHVLTLDPARLDRTALTQALDGISATCRDARAELRTTLRVLRAGESGDGTGPPPGLGGLADLAAAAEAGGARVALAVQVPLEEAVPPAVGAAAYRIVQQSLTNAVQHAGPKARIAVAVARNAAGDSLSVQVTDDGASSPPAGQSEEPGFGIAGMRERARSVGGTLEAGPRKTGGFEVRAALPYRNGNETP